LRGRPPAAGTRVDHFTKRKKAFAGDVDLRIESVKRGVLLKGDWNKAEEMVRSRKKRIKDSKKGEDLEGLQFCGQGAKPMSEGKKEPQAF